MKAWGIVLFVVFAVECVIMLALPHVVPSHSSIFLISAVDAATLTITIAPIVWWLIVRPLRVLLELRTKHLNEVFISIEDERRRVAAELHDGAGQYLTMLVSGLRTAASIAEIEEMQRRCRDLQKVSQDALLEVKRITSGLRPSLLDDLGLALAITRLADDITRHDGVDITVDFRGLPDHRLPPTVETATYRIIQEALNNIVKHAGATIGTVVVALQDGMLVTRIEDDGCGLKWRSGDERHRASGHLGLSGMQERASLLGGEVTIESAALNGTRVVATIPLVAYDRSYDQGHHR